VVSLDQLHHSAVAEVGTWIKESIPRAVELRPDDLGHWSNLEPTAGWLLPLEGGGSLVLVLNRNFPYSEPKFFIRERPDLIEGPHIEGGGKICLTGDIGRVDARRPVDIVRHSYSEALSLLKSNQAGANDADYIEDFAAYWLRGIPRRFKTLIEPGAPSRLVVCWRAKTFTLVAETKELALRFLANMYGDKERNLDVAVAIWMAPLPSPSEYPSSVQDLRALISRSSPDGLNLVDKVLTTSDDPIAVVLMGIPPRGRSVVAGVLIEPRIEPAGPGRKVQDPLHKGFRTGRVPAEVLAPRLQLSRHVADRIDGARTRRPAHLGEPAFSLKAVCLIGAGSLGSGLAKLLLQSGVGSVALVDPQTLSWDNIERHELGADSVSQYKAKELAAVLRKRFPLALNVTGHAADWRDVLRKTPSVVADADLVISTCGDWNAESALNDTHRSGLLRGPVVYGWLEDYALAAHAVAISAQGACFRCGFIPTGEHLLPATRSPRNTEPGCGGGISLYGAIDMAPGQAMIAALSLDLLAGNATAPVYRASLRPQSALVAADADWEPRWLSRYGPPPIGGTIIAGKWPQGDNCSCRS